jgi:hypothetical protein
VELSHTPAAIGAAFDDSNLIASAGLVPLVALAEAAGLPALVAAHVSVPTDKGANADLKTMSLVAGMCAGADSIQDMSILRHGAMGKAFDYCYAPSTLGSFLRQFTFGHVRQLDAVASRFVAALAEQTPLVAGIDDLALVDLDDTIVEVHGHGKQGASFGYTGVRGLNASAATVTAPGGAPVIVATRLRKGSANSAKGAERIVADALGTVRRLRSSGATGMVLLRAEQRPAHRSGQNTYTAHLTPSRRLNGVGIRRTHREPLDELGPRVRIRPDQRHADERERAPGPRTGTPDLAGTSFRDPRRLERCPDPRFTPCSAEHRYPPAGLPPRAHPTRQSDTPYIGRPHPDSSKSTQCRVHFGAPALRSSSVILLVLASKSLGRNGSQSPS